MPSQQALGEFDRLPAPVSSKYGDWSNRWEKASLRYEPPYRPLVRLGVQKQATVTEIQHDIRKTQQEILSDPDTIYRLPNFNLHRSDIVTGGALRPQTAPSQGTAWQTPGEAQAMAKTHDLNERSRCSTPRAGTSHGNQLRRPSRDFGSFESFFGALKPVRRHSFGSESIDSVASSLGTDLNVAELLKQSLPIQNNTGGTSVQSARGGNLVIEVRTGTPPPPSSSSNKEPVSPKSGSSTARGESTRGDDDNKNNCGRGSGCGSFDSGGGSLRGRCSGGNGGSNGNGGNDGSLSKGSLTSSYVYALEASGEGQAFIPHSSMPSLRSGGLRKNFATYPAVALQRHGLHRRPNGAAPRPLMHWPSFDLTLAQQQQQQQRDRQHQQHQQQGRDTSLMRSTAKSSTRGDGSGGCGHRGTRRSTSGSRGGGGPAQPVVYYDSGVQSVQISVGGQESFAEQQELKQRQQQERARAGEASRASASSSSRKSLRMAKASATTGGGGDAVGGAGAADATTTTTNNNSNDDSNNTNSKVRLLPIRTHRATCVDLNADRPRVYPHLEGSAVPFQTKGVGHAALIDHIAGKPRQSNGRVVSKALEATAVGSNNNRRRSRSSSSNSNTNNNNSSGSGSGSIENSGGRRRGKEKHAPPFFSAEVTNSVATSSRGLGSLSWGDEAGGRSAPAAVYLSNSEFARATRDGGGSGSGGGFLPAAGSADLRFTPRNSNDFGRRPDSPGGAQPWTPSAGPDLGLMASPAASQPRR